MNSVQMMHRQEIAFHTTLGYVFTPQNCQGREPQVCRTGPLILDSTSSCERGLVTGHLDDRLICKLKFVKMLRTKIYERNRGHYVIQTRGENYALACREKRQIKSSMSAGTFEVLLPGGCTMSGTGWLLKGERLQFINMTGSLQRIDVTIFDMPVELPTVEPYERDVDTINDIQDVNIKKLDDNNTMYSYDEVAHHLSWVNIAFIIGLIIMIVIAARYLYQKRANLAFCLGPWSKKKKQEKIDQLPLTSVSQTTLTETELKA